MMSVSISEFETIIKESTNRLQKVYFQEFNTKDVFNDLFSFSSLSRFTNNIIALDLKQMGRKVGFSYNYDFSLANKAQEAEEMSKKMEHIYATKKSFLHLFSKYLLRKKQEKYNFSQANLNQVNTFKDKVISYQNDFAKDMIDYQKRYGVELFSESAIERAGKNVMSMCLFADSNNLPKPPKRAMNALALLHPLTDDFMDADLVDKRVVQGISDCVEGKTPITDNKYENLIYTLIEDMFSDFPADKYPIYQDTIRKLHQEQINSLQQKDPFISTEDIVNISLVKGGLSTVAAGYISLGNLTKNQLKFFYEAGGLFQFIDDLGDINKDIDEGVRTIWTERVIDNVKCDEPFYRTAKVHNHIMYEQFPIYSDDFIHGDMVKILYDIGYRMLMSRGYFVHENYFNRQLKKEIKSHAPINYNELGRVMNFFDKQIF